MLVPIGVSELFFFDGEKIAELAEDDTGNALGVAIHRLLGLDLVERLRSDLRVYMLRHESKTAGKEAAGEIEGLRQEYEALKALLAQDRADLDRKKEELRGLIVRKDLLEVRLAERGGDWGASREAQQASAKDLAETLRRDERELRDELPGPYPLSPAADVLSEALEFAAMELASIARAEANTLLQEFASTLKESLDKKSRTTVDRVLADSLQPVNGARPSMDLSHSALARMEHTVNYGIPEAETRVERLARRIASTKDELDIVTVRIGHAPDEAALTEDFNKLAKLNERINDVGADVAVSERELRSRYAAAVNLARSLREKHKALSARQESERPLEYAEGARRLLTDFRRINAERRIGQLEEEFAIAFRRLARKDDIIANARIDPRRFTVTLLNGDGGEVPKTQLSAGEKQIYAIAMLEALARTSGRRLPVIIDTPLGRLDSHHRGNLVNHYFPRASHQVVLLSTDTEVDQSFYRQLYPHISHAFEIQYDDQEHAANLREGYFWRARARATA